MSWDQVRLEVHGLVSESNAASEARDRSAWEEFCTRVALIAREHRYEGLNLQVGYSGQQ